MPQVDTTHASLDKMLDTYDLIDDCIEGQNAVKHKGTKYLPQPNAEDRTPDNIARYHAYVVRAVFYNVTGRTLRGLVGQVFLREPIIEVPKLLDVVVKDADGAGTSLVQLAERGVTNVLSKGRAGVFADYPTTNGETVTRLQQLQGDVRPTISLYSAESVINWRVVTRGGKSMLSLVVIKEMYAKDDDGFLEELEEQYRVLKLDVSGNYVQEIWRKGNADFEIFETHEPKDGTGASLREIPFRFIGVADNTPSVDPAPMYDMAILNIAHYRNSADYEESVFFVGQPTPVITGLDEEWVTKVMGGRVELGSRAAISLPVGADAKLLQADPNTLAAEAMADKERQMIALGAKLVENKEVQRTATEATQEEASENSTLASTAKNVAEAFQWCLEWCAIFVNVTSVRRDASDTTSIKFDLNTDFALSQLSAADRTQLIAEWVANAITFSEMRAILRRAGIATLDDKKAQKEIAEEIANAPQLDLGGPNNPEPDPDPNAPPIKQAA